jgi:hypothetical protein
MTLNLLHVLLTISLALGAVAQTISLYEDRDLAKQRDCVQECLTDYIGPQHKGLVRYVGCGDSRDHSCFCREDLRVSASGYLSGCFAEEFSTTCNGGADYASAVSIYDRYCGFQGGGGVVTVDAFTTADSSGASPTDDASPNDGNNGDSDSRGGPTVTVVVRGAASALGSSGMWVFLTSACMALLS